MLQQLIIIDTLSTLKLFTCALPEEENKYDVRVMTHFLAYKDAIIVKECLTFWHKAVAICIKNIMATNFLCNTMEQFNNPNMFLLQF